MTAQIPERIILNDLPRELYSDPLYPLLEARGMEDFAEKAQGVSSACWRGYRGTWQIIEGRLHLIHINLPWPEAPFPRKLRKMLLRAIPADDLPVLAGWFSGKLRVRTGRRLAYRHAGFAHVFERERHITVENGNVTKEGEVKFRAPRIRVPANNPGLRALLREQEERRKAAPPGSRSQPDDDGSVDRWPPDYVRGTGTRST